MHKQLTIFAKSAILDVRLGSEYVSVYINLLGNISQKITVRSKLEVVIQAKYFLKLIQKVLYGKTLNDVLASLMLDLSRYFPLQAHLFDAGYGNLLFGKT